MWIPFRMGCHSCANPSPGVLPHMPASFLLHPVSIPSVPFPLIGCSNLVDGERAGVREREREGRSKGGSLP